MNSSSVCEKRNEGVRLSFLQLYSNLHIRCVTKEGAETDEDMCALKLISRQLPVWKNVHMLEPHKMYLSELWSFQCVPMQVLVRSYREVSLRSDLSVVSLLTTISVLTLYLG